MNSELNRKIGNCLLCKSFVSNAIIILFLTLFASNIVEINAQIGIPPPLPIADDKPIKVDTLLFTIPLRVNDSKGRSFPGLKKSEFKIFQDGEEQDIELFMNEETPMNVAILLDTSRSTESVLGDIKKAAREFIKLLKKEDQAMIAGFDNRIKFYCNLTSDRKVLSKAIVQTQVGNFSGSDLYLAVDSVLKKKFAGVKGRKAIIVLTDGVVSGSSVTVQQTLDNLQKFDTIFYPVIFTTDFYKDKTPTRKNSSLIRLLQILAEETNGTFYEKDKTKLKEAFASIAVDLKNQYLIGFYPEYISDDKSRGFIKVEVKQKGLFIRSRKKLKL